MEKAQKPCLVDECDRLHRSNDFCWKHYQAFNRWRKKDPTVNLTPEMWISSGGPWNWRRNRSKICLVDGCDEPYRTKGFCRDHYQSFHYARKKNPNLTSDAWILSAGSLKSSGRRSTICLCEVCGGDHVSLGFCSGHYQAFTRVRKKNLALTPEAWILSGGPWKWGRSRRETCRLDECDEPYRTKGFCSRHYDRFHEARQKNPALTPETWKGPRKGPRKWVRKSSTGVQKSSPKPSLSPSGSCRVEGCDGKHRSKGFCSPHYWQFDRDCKKDPSLTPETWDPDNRPQDRRRSPPVKYIGCRVPDCDGKHHSKGFCQSHYNQFYNARQRNPSLTPETWDPNLRPRRSL